MPAKTRLPKEYSRHRVFLFFSAFFGYGWYIVNRTSYTATVPAIMEEFRYGKQELGLITSSFALSYALSKVLLGIVSDYISPKFVFAGGLALSGAFNVAFGMSNSLLSMCGLWFVNGLAQGAGWPPVAKLIKTWVLDHESGRWWSTISTSMNLAAGLHALLSGTIILLLGWRYVFYISGVTAFVISLFILLVTKNRPEDVGLLSLEELEQKSDDAIQKRIQVVNDVERQRPKLSALFHDYFLWVISIGYLLVSMIRGTLADAGWGQLYLIQEKNATKLDAADAMGSFQLGGLFGSLLVGFASDYLVIRYPAIGPYARVPVLCVCTAVLAVAMNILIFSAILTKVWIACIFFILGACIFGPISIFGMLAVQNAQKGLEGSSHSVAALAAQGTELYCTRLWLL
ncbi:glucose-6-phosphate exchanger SLC37A4-like isoform X2 [Corticium candelabrum]|uniref:glucose-6-phosphate exchanger SLC37A4-like isoform X2 n=1 Tax=Corticium candelabrum TaxID=121492 RepID=UPI002E257233|nr:glucose-6-phosphate exchanger SLC37A4-like isoform X2 [Corticium candelabrum]XP_062504342.1 glucose-6-phosphate exchanger SLC37A4-like isoform X2 [Corticium candelabrum]